MMSTKKCLNLKCVSPGITDGSKVKGSDTCFPLWAILALCLTSAGKQKEGFTQITSKTTEKCCH